MSGKIDIFLVDDHPLVRAALMRLLEDAGFTVTGQAGKGTEALAHPGLSFSRLALVDLSLGEESGVDLIRRLRESGLLVLAYSMHEGSNVVRRTLEAGADGYVTKRESAEELLEAIADVLAGRRHLSPRVAAVLKEPGPLETLSGQQRQIYHLLGQGFSNEKIAQQLGISGRTLESYFVRILDKLSEPGVKELRRRAIGDAVGSDPGADI